jgi:hypothetical protein
MRIYLAGPMRGIPNLNEAAFNAAAAKLRAEGHTVFNPAERDVETFGPNVLKSPSGSERTQARVAGLSVLAFRREVFAADCAWICAHADAIYLLPGWQNSKGAIAERALGIALGLQIVELAA